MDDGAGLQKIEDDAELRAVRAQARRVRLQSLVLAVVLTAVALAIPT
jgi:hypothetical protein